MYAAPPGVPLMMVLVATVGKWRLRKEKMTLNFDKAMTSGACADVVAFDKTGTLTHSAVSSSCNEAQKWFFCKYQRINDGANHVAASDIQGGVRAVEWGQKRSLNNCLNSLVLLQDGMLFLTPMTCLQPSSVIPGAAVPRSSIRHRLVSHIANRHKPAGLVFP